MKPLRPPRFAPTRQHGFSLVELMVGMVIGLLLLLVVSSMYLSQRASYNTQGDLGTIQENSRAIAQMLQREARQAGYTDATVLNDFGINTIIDAANDTGANSADALTFRYFGSSSPGLVAFPASDPAGSDGTITDCLGNPVSAMTMITDTFTIATDAAGRPWLACNGTNLFPGVETFQVLLGEDTDNDLTINRYMAPGSAVNVSNVRALQISMVLRGDSLANAAPASLTLNHFGKAYAPGDAAPVGDPGSVTAYPADGRLRKHITFYVGVRNRLN
jgi:type IV pilus assembly protein PilW